MVPRWRRRNQRSNHPVSNLSFKISTSQTLSLSFFTNRRRRFDYGWQIAHFQSQTRQNAVAMSEPQCRSLRGNGIQRQQTTFKYRHNKDNDNSLRLETHANMRQVGMRPSTQTSSSCRQQQGTTIPPNRCLSAAANLRGWLMQGTGLMDGWMQCRCHARINRSKNGWLIA